MDLSKALETPNEPTTEAAQMSQIDPETGEVIETDLMVAPITVTGEFDFSALDEAEVGINVKPIYWSPTKAGQTSRGYFQGYNHISKNEPEGLKQIEVAQWLNGEGMFINGGAGFVKLFADIPVGSPIQITYKGKEKTAKGFSVNTFEINLLNLKK